MAMPNTFFGILVVVVGVYAIIYNKYPGKLVSYENAKKKYNTVSERRLTVFDGSFCVIYGAAYIFLEVPFLFILLVAYYPIRLLLLKNKLI
jgi:uncharacterized membrane protein